MGEGSKKQKIVSGAWQNKNFVREFSAGGVVFRDNKWLITLSAASDLYPKQVWRLPKGRIDENETTEVTALRETKEEGGVEAKIVKKIETTKYFFTALDKARLRRQGKVLKFVTFYLMEWKKDLPEGFDGETSEIAWLPYDEAYKKLSFSGEKQILKKARAMV